MAKRGPSFKNSQHPRDRNGRFAKKGGGSSSGTVALRTVRQGIRVPRVYTADTRLAIGAGGTSRPPAIRRANSGGSARGLAIAGAAAVAGAGVVGASVAYKKRQAKKRAA